MEGEHGLGPEPQEARSSRSQGETLRGSCPGGSQSCNQETEKELSGLLSVVMGVTSPSQTGSHLPASRREEPDEGSQQPVHSLHAQHYDPSLDRAFFKDGIFPMLCLGKVKGWAEEVAGAESELAHALLGTWRRGELPSAHRQLGSG